MKKRYIVKNGRIYAQCKPVKKITHIPDFKPHRPKLLTDGEPDYEDIEKTCAQIMAIRRQNELKGKK